MARVTLNKKKPTPKASTWNDDFYDEPGTAARAYKRVRDLEHELRVLQDSNREVIKHAEKLAREEGKRQAARKFNQELNALNQKIASLEHALHATGQEWACPECGCLILPADIIRRETDS